MKLERMNLLWPYRNAIAALLVFGFVSNILMLIPTVYMLQVFDRVMVSRSELTLIVVSLIALYLFGVLALTEWSRSRLLVRLGTQIDSDLSSQTFHAVYASNLKAHLSNSPMLESKRGFTDLGEIRQFISGAGMATLLDLPWTFIYVFVLFLMHPLLGQMALVFAVVQVVFALFGHLRLRRPTYQSSLVAAQGTQLLQSSLKGVEAITAMGMTARLKNAWLTKNSHAQTAQFKSQQIQHSVASASKFIRYMQQSLTLAAGAILVIRGELNPGAMIAANILCSRALAPIEGVAGSWRSLLSARQAYARLKALHLSAFASESAKVETQKVVGDLRCQNVSLLFPSRTQAALRNIDFHSPAGSFTLILGPSGSGKSCLARLLLGIWQPTSGTVSLDNAPMADWQRAQLGSQMGYLPQSIDLFDDSIAANIARLGPIDPQAVVAAAKTTGLHELILRLPIGYETRLGEASYQLSGGVRQRIGLARAVYGDPKVIVLDEPNANLDEVGEKALLQTLKNLKSQGTTLFVISHRSHLIDLSDRLLIMEDGMVQANGPKDDLMATIPLKENAR